MKTRYIVALSMIAGAALGGAAIQALHAQAKPPAYVITHTEITDQAALNDFSSKVPATMQAFGGKYLVRGGKVTPLEGDAPKVVIVTAFDSVEKAHFSFCNVVIDWSAGADPPMVFSDRPSIDLAAWCQREVAERRRLETKSETSGQLRADELTGWALR